MRYALSAAAAASGVVLFASALFGQPEAYLRHARQQWDAWINFEPSDPVANQDEERSAALAARVQALQDEVSQLRDQLAAKQATAEVAQATLPAASPPPRIPQVAQALPVTPDTVVTPPTTTPEKRTVAAPAERREAAGKPAGATPPKPAPARPEPDDARSVLARLRQAQPAPAAPPPIVDAPEERPKPIVSPAVARMTAAQAAFNNGRVEDARRLLQEAQLLLVFRSPGSSSEDASAAGRGSVDIAHALEALGSNDVVRCRLFIDRAINDMEGLGTNAPEREASGKRTGYAPAYPPR